MKKTWKGFLTEVGRKDILKPQVWSEAKMFSFTVWTTKSGGSLIPCRVTIEVPENRKRYLSNGRKK